MLLEIPVIVGRSGALVLLAEKDDINTGRHSGNAQTYQGGMGYSEIKPLQVWYKFLNNVTDVKPALPWTGGSNP